MPGEEDRAMMERETAEMMARDFSPSLSYSQRLSAGSTKLGINSNIYSLYQNKQVGARSSLGEAGSYGMGMTSSSSSSSLPGRSEELSKPPAQFSGLRQGAESPVEAASVYSELGQAVRQPGGGSSSEKLYTACMQERTELQNTCREQQDTMEPDSSTDSREQGDANGLAEEEEEEEEENTEANTDRMQQLLKEHARMFNVKNEPEVLSAEAAKRGGGTYKSPQEELAELMKLTNEKLFKSSNTNKSLPLSVEIDEQQDSSCDSVSPPRHPYMVTNSLSPRKRGRKPKHYSEILYELGQRGISITKTSKPSPVAASQSTEMVVSENGAVSHKASGQQLKCPHCNKILTTSVGLMYHIRLHTGQSGSGGTSVMSCLGCR